MDPGFTCPKCGGNMIKGFAADKSDNYFMKLSWIDGEPKPISFLGLTGDNVDISNKALRDVRGIRCERCGYLELFAV